MIDLMKYQRVRFKPMGRDFTGADCWGIVRLYYKEELGIELPRAAVSLCDFSGIEDKVLEHIAKFEELPSARLHSIALMRFGKRFHVGVVVDQNKGLVLHSTQKHGAVICKIDSLESIASSCFKFFRLKETTPCHA